ncbi:MAG: hypothetical protein RIM99_03885 [Cyclobacteriaceae bacterium]
MKKLFVVLMFVIVGCGGPAKKEAASDNKSTQDENEPSSGYILAISKIDNNVNVYVEDSLIFTSGTIHNSPEVDFQIDLSQFIKDGSETLRIELLNGVEPYDQQIDPYWEIMYDLIIDGEIVDFIHEYDDDNAIGKVYENSYLIKEWIPE